MRIVSIKTLKEFWENPKYRDSEQPIKAWYAEAKKAKWKTPQQIKALYRSASIIQNNRVVFNIGGNKYRLVVAVRYEYELLFVRFIGTHKQYDAIHAEDI